MFPNKTFSSEIVRCSPGSLEKRITRVPYFCGKKHEIKEIFIITFKALWQKRSHGGLLIDLPGKRYGNMVTNDNLIMIAHES